MDWETRTGAVGLSIPKINGSRDVLRRNILALPKPSGLVLAREARVAGCVEGHDRGEFSGLDPRDEGFRRAMLFHSARGRISAASLLDGDQPYRN